MKPRVLIVGCGDTGSALAQQLLAQGWQVWGLRRTVDALPSGVLPVAGDLLDDRVPLGWPEQTPDCVVFAAAPDSHGPADYQALYVDGLRRVKAWLERHGQVPRRLFHVSSTSVYAQSDGSWVDEDSVTTPEGHGGRALREAEEVALAGGYPATCVRLAGIYGPGREWLVGRVRQGLCLPAQPLRFSNRIHRDDAAGLLACLLNECMAGTPLASCYLGVDDEPAPLHEVVDWLRAQLGVTRVAEGDSARRGGSKRCSNARARALGWAPRYSSYREGYSAMLAGQADPSP